MLRLRRTEKQGLPSDQVEFRFYDEQMSIIPLHLPLPLNRIIERAYALRDAREEQRRKIVEEKYNQQWRDACDDVRAMDSKALALHMVGPSCSV